MTDYDDGVDLSWEERLDRRALLQRAAAAGGALAAGGLLANGAFAAPANHAGNVTFYSTQLA